MCHSDAVMKRVLLRALELDMMGPEYVYVYFKILPLETSWPWTMDLKNMTRTDREKWTTIFKRIKTVSTYDERVAERLRHWTRDLGVRVVTFQLSLGAPFSVPV